MLLQGSSCRQVTHRRVVCDNVFLTPRCSSESPIRSNHGEMLVSIPQTIKKSRKCTLNTQKRPFQLVNKISCWLLCNDALEHSFAEKKVWKERTRCQFFFSQSFITFCFLSTFKHKTPFYFPPFVSKTGLSIYTKQFTTLWKNTMKTWPPFYFIAPSPPDMFSTSAAASPATCARFLATLRLIARYWRTPHQAFRPKRRGPKAKKSPPRWTLHGQNGWENFRGFIVFTHLLGGGMLTAMKGWISLPSKKAFGICWDSASTSWSILRTHKQPAFWRSVRIQFLESQRILVLHSWVTSCFIACWFQLSQNRWTFTMKILKIKLHT